MQRYRAFISQHPNQHTYYQPILDVLEYRPSNLEAIADVIMVEGKNDFYTLSYFQEVILKTQKRIALLPGSGSGSLDTVIRLYCAWGKNFVILLDSDTEGKKQKNRYQNAFSGILNSRIFTFEDVEPLWSNHEMEELFHSGDLLKIQKSVFPDVERFNKKLFNAAIQENLLKKVSVSLSESTTDIFQKLLKFLSEALLKLN